MSQILPGDFLLTDDLGFGAVEFLDREPFTWSPPFLILLNELLSYGLLAGLLVGFARSRSARQYLGVTSFSIWCKAANLVQPWYLLMISPLALTIEAPRMRLWVFALAALIDPLSTVQLAVGPRGMTIGDALASITAFTPFVLP